jgi:hypothetical protein
MDGIKCRWCGKSGATKVCMGCLLVGYCDAQCQENDWKNHEQDCQKLNEKAISILTYPQPLGQPKEDGDSTFSSTSGGHEIKKDKNLVELLTHLGEDEKKRALALLTAYHKRAGALSVPMRLNVPLDALQHIVGMNREWSILPLLDKQDKLWIMDVGNGTLTEVRGISLGEKIAQCLMPTPHLVVMQGSDVRTVVYRLDKKGGVIFATPIYTVYRKSKRQVVRKTLVIGQYLVVYNEDGDEHIINISTLEETEHKNKKYDFSELFSFLGIALRIQTTQAGVNVMTWFDPSDPKTEDKPVEFFLDKESGLQNGALGTIRRWSINKQAGILVGLLGKEYKNNCVVAYPVGKPKKTGTMRFRVVSCIMDDEMYEVTTVYNGFFMTEAHVSSPETKWGFLPPTLPPPPISVKVVAIKTEFNEDMGYVSGTYSLSYSKSGSVYVVDKEKNWQLVPVPQPCQYVAMFDKDLVCVVEKGLKSVRIMSLKTGEIAKHIPLNGRVEWQKVVPIFHQSYPFTPK